MSCTHLLHDKDLELNVLGHEERDEVVEHQEQIPLSVAVREHDRHLLPRLAVFGGEPAALLQLGKGVI